MDDFFGDYRWFDRPGCFSNPQCERFVADLDAAKRELAQLYPQDQCRKIVEGRHPDLVAGLFLDDAWDDAVDAILQLGADLTFCDDWQTRTKLVARLRSEEHYDGARFEVGVWAGLRRMGLHPRLELATSPVDKRADFVVDEGGMRVAIEVKSLSDPDYRRNLASLVDLLGQLLARSAASRGIGEILLVPETALADALNEEVDVFQEKLQSGMLPCLKTVAAAMTVGDQQIPGLCTLRFVPRPEHWMERDVATVEVVEEPWTLEEAARRALGRVKSKARAQLLATPADVRVAVIWGSLDFMPARVVARKADELLLKSRSTVQGVDYIAFLNSHRRGARIGWVTDVAFISVQEPPNDPRRMAWARGLGAWSLLYSGEAR